MIHWDEIETDVAVLGGGTAGCLAAIGAAERSVRVAVIDKATLTGGGDGSSGQKFFQSWIPGEGEWDTPEQFARRQRRRSLKLSSWKRLRLYAEEVWPMVQRLEAMGVRFRHPVHGNYVRKQTLGSEVDYSILFDGRDFKKVTARHAVSMGVSQYNQGVAFSLLRTDSGVNGVVVFDFRRGRFLVVKTKAVVVATSHVGRLYKGVAGSPFNSWHSPYNTGDGTIMAYQAGAKLANLEFAMATLVPRGYAIPGLAALIGMGGHLINAAGERFMARYHARAEHAPRSYLVKGVYTENKEGRGPCSIDCRHFSEEVMGEMLRHLIIERGMWDEYWDQARIDLASRPMEMEIGGELHCEEGGVLVDEECRSSVPGLYAAGECTGVHGVPRCCVEGYLAGISAAGYARELREGDPNLRPEPLAEARDRVERMFSSSPGTHYREVENSLRETMSSYVGFEKCEDGLRTALEKLEALRDAASVIRAQNYHEVLRGIEAQNLLDLSLLIAETSLCRQESRMGNSLFWRSDYPETNSPQWEKLVTVQQKDGRRFIQLEPVPA